MSVIGKQGRSRNLSAHRGNVSFKQLATGVILKCFRSKKGKKIELAHPLFHWQLSFQSQNRPCVGRVIHITCNLLFGTPWVLFNGYRMGGIRSFSELSGSPLFEPIRPKINCKGHFHSFAKWFNY